MYTNKSLFIFNLKVIISAEKIPIGKGVRQSDTNLSKVFTLALENVFKEVTWNYKGLNVNGVHLNHLRFADNIVLISAAAERLSAMVNDLVEKSTKIGLSKNLRNTK